MDGSNLRKLTSQLWGLEARYPGWLPRDCEGGSVPPTTSPQGSAAFSVLLGVWIQHPVSAAASPCVSICVLAPPFHADPSPTGLEPLTPVRPHLNSTNYICKDLFSESGHILRSSESEVQYVSFQRGTQFYPQGNPPLLLHSPQRSLGRLRACVGGGHI